MSAAQDTGGSGGRRADVEAALLLLERMGLTPADLAAAGSPRREVPTFAAYVPAVSASVSAGTRLAHGSYWVKVLDQWAGRRLDEPSPSEIRQLMAHVRSAVVVRRNGRGGRCAAEHLVAALRCLYRHAEDDGLIAEKDNPARKVDKPRRLPSTPRWPRSTRPRPRRGTTRRWTACCCGCIPRQRAGAAARWPCGPGTWTRCSAWSCCGRKARRCGGSRCRPR